MAKRIVEVKHHLNKPTEQYDCELVARGDGWVVVRYVTDRDYDLGPVCLRRGTVTLAHYWEEQPYVLWDLRSPAGERIGWLCHICRPPAISADRIEYTDLVLDIWFWPDGTHVMLDEAELADCVEAGWLSEEEADAVRRTAKRVVRDFSRVVESIVWHG